METWQEVLRKNSIASLDTLANRFGAENFPELDRLRLAAENFEFRISPAMVDLIKSPDDPIWRQYVPTVQELEVHDGIVDSLNEDADSPVPNITHRYPDRALFLVSPVCASYCRFCTRRRKVGDPEKIPMSQFESAFQYLESHTEIRDVIMSGGDPLILHRPAARRHPVAAPEHQAHRDRPHREPGPLPPAGADHAGALRHDQEVPPGLFINTHFNHPDELTPAAVKGLGMLADAGIPLGCQTVLLKGVNDDPRRHEAADAAPADGPGAALLHLHGRPGRRRGALPDQRRRPGLQIMEALRGWTSGLAVPHFVIDAPGGGGKIPLLPEYVVSMSDEEVVLRNFRGEQFVYKQPNEELAVAAMGRRTDPEYLFQPTLQLKKRAKRTSKVPKRKLA